MNNRIQPLIDLFRSQRGFDLDKELQAIMQEVARIETIKTLAEHQGWVELKKLYVDRIAKNDRIIVELASNPIKNENELRSREALRRAMLGLIGCVDVMLGAEASIQKRFQQLLRTSQLEAPPFMAADEPK